MNTYVHLVMNHELCHPERMSASPGQGLGQVCLLCVPSSGLTQTGCSRLGREDKKAGLGQEDQALSSQGSWPNTPSLALTIPAAKPASPTRSIGWTQSPNPLIL